MLEEVKLSSTKFFSIFANDSPNQSSNAHKTIQEKLMFQEPEVQSTPNRPQRSDPLVKSEKLLLDRIKQGDRSAFRLIVEGHKDRMHQVARSVLINKDNAEDVVQEAFIKAYKAIPLFQGNASLATWLHRITFLTAIDFRRREKHNPLIATSNDSEKNPLADLKSKDRVESAIEAEVLRQEIERAIQLLTPLEQSIFTLRHFQSFKIKDIAMIVERSEGTVKNILFRAIRKLRRELNDFAVIESQAEYRSC